MFLKIGHRGAMGYKPENTLASFQKAIDLKVDVIEFDVYQCKTKELVIIHDDKVDRTTNGTGYVQEKSLSQLQKLNAGQGQKIPLLTQALDLIKRQAKVNIELKGSKTAEPVAKTIKNYINKENWQPQDFLISSFNHYEIKKFKKFLPNIKTGALITGIPIDYSNFALKAQADSVNLNLEFINQKFVKHAHQNNLKVFVYTVNDLDDIARMKKLKVDGIFSNYPDRL